MKVSRHFLPCAVLALSILVQPALAAFHGSAGGVVITPTGGVNVGDGAMFPFVNLLKMSSLGVNDSGTTFVYPTNLNANQLPTGTLSTALGYFTYLPDNYFGKYVLTVTGTVSGASGIVFQNGFYGEVYATTGSPTIGGCNNGNVPPCYAQNGFGMTGSNFTVTFDFSTRVTGVQNNGSGLIQLLATNNNLANGQNITVDGLVGSNGNGCNANGNWTITNRTATTIDLSGSSFPIGCTYVSGGGIFPYQNTSTNLSTFFAFGAGTYSVTNVALCKLADYNADNTCNTTAGKTAWTGGFNDDFVQKLAALKPKYIRFLDYNNFTFGPATPSYADYTQTSWFSYGTENWNPLRWFGTASGTDTYTATCSGSCTYLLTAGAPADGDIVQLYIPNSNLTVNPTLTLTDKNSVTSAAIPLSDFQGQRQGKVSGSVTVGDTVTLTFGASTTCIPSTGTTTASYTAQAGNTFASIVVGLQAAVAANSKLTSQPMKLSVQNPLNDGSIYFNYASNACTVTITPSVSGAATELVAIGNNQVGGITTNTLYYLVYNSLLGKWISQVGSRAGWPYSVQINLANAVSTAAGVNTGCWLQANLIWSTASFTSLANYAAANPCAGGTWLEVSNEIWNSGNPETGLASNLGGSIGLGPAAVEFMTLRDAQWFSIAQTSFAGQLQNLHTIGAFQFGTVNANQLNGTTLCGTSCGNTAYQNAIGVDHNTNPNQPHNFYTAISQAPYYSGAVMNGQFFGYGSWSATSSSVSGNVLTVSGTVTGTIYPNQGISSCDGVYIASPTPSNFVSGQLTGKVTTTLNGAVSKNQGTPITLTSTAGLLANMYAYDATTGMLEGIIASVNSGASQITVTRVVGGPQTNLYASASTNDTMVFGGLTGTYQLNSTSCSAASGTITGGDVLGMQYAADNYNGVNGALGSQQDALNWTYQDALNGAWNGVTAQTVTVQSMNDGYAVANNVGGYGLPVQDYEGGFQGSAPSTGQATGIGLSSSYGGSTGYIQKLLTAFKNNSLMNTLETTRHSQEIAALPANSATCWYVFSSNPTWALFPGDLYSPPPYKSYDAIQGYN